MYESLYDATKSIIKGSDYDEQSFIMNTNTTPVFSEKRTQIIVWNLLFLMPIIGMVVDLVAPSLPAIATSLQVSNSITKNIISIYLLGYALGNFFLGFLTDALGRQKLIRISLFGFVISSLLPVFFPDIKILLLARFLQGITIGGTALIARAIFSDILPAEKLVRLGALIGTMWGLGPVIGPVIGGYLQFYIGWKAGFWFFSIISFILFIAVFIIVPETHLNRHPLNVKTIKKNLLEIFSNRLFMALVILMGLAYSLIIVFNTLGPFLIQAKFHYSPVFFGHLALTLGFTFLISTIVCRHTLQYFKVEQLLLLAINLFFGVATAALIASYFFSQSILLVVIASACMFFACGFIFPMSMGKGISLFRHIAGTASATMYLINIFITSLTSFLVSFLNVQSVIPLIWIFFVLLLIAVFIYWWLIHRE